MLELELPQSMRETFSPIEMEGLVSNRPPVAKFCLCACFQANSGNNSFQLGEWYF